MMIRPIVPLVLAFGLATPAFAQQASPIGHEPALLVHGNYCGPGNNAPLPPVDALDAACARHDACTPNGGLPSKACNLRLQHEAERLMRDPRQPDDLRAMAGLIAAGTGMIPSEPAERGAPAYLPAGIGDAVQAPVRPQAEPPALDDAATEDGEE